MSATWYFGSLQLAAAPIPRVSVDQANNTDNAKPLVHQLKRPSDEGISHFRRLFLLVRAPRDMVVCLTATTCLDVQRRQEDF